MNLSKRIMVMPGRKIKLSKYDTGDTAGFKEKTAAMDAVKENAALLADLQYLLYAENKHSLLIVLQAMDGGGKDGTIRHVMTGINPQGCRVTSFKAPTPEEQAHDFLWRVHREVPPRGWIGIFNRSHYEDVLAARVRKLVPPSVWRGRYEHINHFEKLLSESGVTILEFFLHISKREQKERLQKRLEDPRRAWKFDPGDWEDRRRWKEYMTAYEDAISRCGTA